MRIKENRVINPKNKKEKEKRKKMFRIGNFCSISLAVFFIAYTSLLLLFVVWRIDERSCNVLIDQFVLLLLSLYTYNSYRNTSMLVNS